MFDNEVIEKATWYKEVNDDVREQKSCFKR